MRRLPIVIALLVASSAYAAPAAAASYDQIGLTAQATIDVPNDIMTADLYVEAEGTDAAALADQTNQVMRQALAEASASNGIKTRSTGYDTEPEYTFDPKTRQNHRSGWRVRQSMRVTSRDFDNLKQLLGRLQSSLQVASIRFGISDEAREAAENHAISEALRQFNQRAALVQDTLHYTGWKIERLDIATPQTGFQPPRPMMAMAAAKADVTPPDAIPGGSEVKAMVSGTIQLQR